MVRSPQSEMNIAVLSLISYVLAMVVVTSVCLVLCFITYLHYLHKINDHLPGPPRSSFIFGHLTDIVNYIKVTGRTFSEFLLEKRLEHGPIFVLFLLHKPMVFLGDSGYLKQVFIDNHENLYKNPFIYHKIGFIYGERGGGYGLISNTDEQSWRKRRLLMNPAFHRRCLRDFMSKFNDVSDRLLARMDTVVDADISVSMVEEFANATLEAISQVSFNINTRAIEVPKSPFSAAIRHYLKGVQQNIEIPLDPTLLGIFQFKYFQNSAKKTQINAVRFLRKFAFDCIATRMKNIADNTAVPEDLLSILIKTGSFSMDELIDEFLTIFVAGQDTTANSMSFALYGVISNPHVEAKLLNEVREVLGDRDHVEFDDLAKFKYLGQILDESLRKHPTAPAPSRILAKDIKVGGFHIPKGNGINSSQLIFGMNPDIWETPEVFDPDRFSNTKNIPNFRTTHFPFSIGPRNCIGHNFATFESKVILAKLLRKFQFRLLPGQTDRMKARLTTTPRDGVMCNVSGRV